MTDADLVRQALGGRSASYGELARRWSGRIAALCHTQTRAGDAVEDLTQEVLLRGFRALGSLKEPEKFGPWLRGIAQRVCLDWIKSRKRTPVGFGELSNGDVAGAVPSGEPSADEAACQADEQARLLRHVEQLPETLREVLMIYYYDEVTYREMAELLEVSPATINKRLTQARALLRRRLSQPFIPTAAPLP